MISSTVNAFSESFSGSWLSFGDRMEPGGNDHSLGEAVKDMGGSTYHVKNWVETRTILEGIHD